MKRLLLLLWMSLATMLGVSILAVAAHAATEADVKYCITFYEDRPNALGVIFGEFEEECGVYPAIIQDTGNVGRMAKRPVPLSPSPVTLFEWLRNSNALHLYPIVLEMECKHDGITLSWFYRVKWSKDNVNLCGAP